MSLELSWDDIERSAQVIFEKRNEAKLEEQLALKEKAQEEAAKRALELQRDRERMQQILFDLKVEQTLAAVQDKWGEGRLIPFDLNAGKEIGFQLLSDPYPLIKASGSFSRRDARLYLKHESVSMCVSFLPVNHTDKDKLPIYIIEDNIYNLNSRKGRSIEAAVKQSGFFEGLRETAIIERSRISDNRTSIDSKNLEDFYAGIYKHVTRRADKYGSLPSQIRAWTEEALDNLPEQLKKNEVLGQNELSAWGHKIVKSNSVIQMLERTFFPGLGLEY